MISLKKKSVAFLSAFLLATMFASAEEKTFEIPGKGTLTRDVTLRKKLGFDEYGRIEYGENPDGSMEYFDHDKKGRMISYEKDDGYKKTYTYNKKGVRTKSKDTKGAKETYTYDESGKLVSVSNSNGIERTYTYDELGHMTEVKVTKEGEVLFSDKYEYDELGRRLKKINTKGVEENYVYDEDERLSLVKCSDGTEKEFVYDKAGKMAYKRDTTRGTEHEEFFEYENDEDGILMTLYIYATKAVEITED